MYAMSYDSKVWIEGYGLWYQGLASISPRYEFDVLGGLGLKGQPMGPSRVFSALAVQLTTPPAAAAAAAVTGGPPPVAALTAPDEDCEYISVPFVIFAWIAASYLFKHFISSSYMALWASTPNTLSS